jgi:hypothetical protein
MPLYKVSLPDDFYVVFHEDPTIEDDLETQALDAVSEEITGTSLLIVELVTNVDQVEDYLDNLYWGWNPEELTVRGYLQGKMKPELLVKSLSTELLERELLSRRAPSVGSS